MSYYEVHQFSLLAYHIPYKYIMELNKKTTHMVHRQMHQNDSTTRRLQEFYNKASTQFKYETMVCRSRKMKIKILEDKTTHLDTFPHGFKQYNAILEENFREIASMKEKLKIPDAHPMQTYELEEVEKEIQNLKKKLHYAQMKNKEFKDQVVLVEAQLQ